MVRWRLFVWERLSCFRASCAFWSVPCAGKSPAAPRIRVFSSCSLPTGNADGTSVSKISRQVSNAVKLGQEDVAAKLIQSFPALQEAPSAVFCNYILNSCAISCNSKIAKLVCAYMLQEGVTMNEVSYACFLRALCRDNQVNEAVFLLESLGKGERLVLPNTIMCNIVLNGCFHAKNKLLADRCLKVMSETGVQGDEMTYVELMKLSGLLQDFDGISQWWEELVKICEPSPSSRCVLVVALCRTKSLTEALAAMKDMSDAVVQNKICTRLPGKKLRIVSDAVRVLSRSNDVSKQLKVDTAMADRAQWSKRILECSQEAYENLKGFEGWEVRKELQDSMNALINAAGHGGEFLVAESLFSEMRHLGLRLSIYTYNALLRAVVKGRGVHHGLRIIRSMEATGVTPDTCSFTALLNGYCEEDELDKAESLLYTMQEGRPSQWPSRFTYNMLLKACVRKDDPERALRIFSRMKEENVAPDTCTYIALLGVCGNVNLVIERDASWSRHQVVQRLIAIETYMARSGVQHTPRSVSALMKVLGDEGMLELLMQRLRAFRSSSSSMLDATSYNAAMHGCVKAQQLDAALEIYSEMRSLGVIPDRETYNILIDVCSYKKSLSRAFELVDAMQREGIKPDLVTYNTLIKVTCHSGELDAGVNMLNTMRSHDVHPDVGTYNTLLSSAAYHKRIDLTEFLIEDMRCAGVQPNNHSCLQVVNGYINCGKDEDAAEALRVVSARMLSPHTEVNVSNSDEEDEDGGSLDDLPLDNPVNQALYISRLAALAHASEDDWTPERSSWASRIRLQYDGSSTSP